MFRLLVAAVPSLIFVAGAELHAFQQSQAFLQISDILHQGRASPSGSLHNSVKLYKYDGEDEKDEKNDDKDKDGKDKEKPKKKKKQKPEKTTPEPTTTTSIGMAVMVGTTLSPTTVPPAPASTLTPETSAPTTPLPPATAAPTIVPLSSVCASALSCGQCTAMPECGWCSLEGRCVEGNKLSPTHELCGGYEFSGCSAHACGTRLSCNECLQEPQCGWCGSTATCEKGTEAGPLLSGDCPPSRNPFEVDWMHSSSALKCGTHLGLHDGSLWGSLRGLMDASKSRVAKLEAGVAAPITPAPTKPPPPPPPTTTLYATTFVAVFPTTTTTTTTTKKKTTPAPTTTTMMTTTPYVPAKKCKDKPETVVDVDVCQNCKPPGEGGGEEEGGGGNETVPEGAAPPPPEFLQRFFLGKQRRKTMACCFLHPQCCLPDC